MAFLAFAVDLGHINVTVSELQNAADAGAGLSGAAKLALGQTAANAAAKTWARKNVAGGQTVSVVSAEDVQVGVWDAETATFTPAEREPERDAGDVSSHRCPQQCAAAVHFPDAG